MLRLAAALSGLLALVVGICLLSLGKPLVFSHSLLRHLMSFSVRKKESKIHVFYPIPSSTRLYRMHGGGPKQTPATTAGLPNAEVLLTEVVESDDEIKDGDPAVFVRTEWINTGKQWQDSFPTCVKRVRSASRAIPTQVRDILVPPTRLSVTEMLQLREDSLEPISGGAVKFSSDAPTVFAGPADSLCLTDDGVSSFRRHLRSARTNAEAVKSLRAEFNDAWLAGACSVQNRCQ